MAKDYYSKANIEAALLRVREIGSKDLRLLIQRVKDEIDRRSESGDTADLENFTAEATAELEQRPTEVGAERAKLNADAEERTRGMTLRDATRYAFEVLPASPEEQRILPIIAANPGASAAEMERLYGKGDFILCVGHTVYDRYGCFRHLQSEHSDFSTIIIEKENKGGRVHYRLRPEAEAAFRDLGLIG